MNITKLNTILLIDDDPITNYLNEKIIRRTRITDNIQVAYNGQEALSLVMQQGTGFKALPELIILDLKMPVMNGARFLMELAKLHPGWHETTTIAVLTNSLHQKDLEMYSRYPLWFLLKPLTDSKVQSICQSGLLLTEYKNTSQKQ